MPIRVLIADDSELMRRQIRTILEPDRDIEICAEAENGLEALRKVLECRPDLVVVDVNMPVMNGWQPPKIKDVHAEPARVAFHAIRFPADPN